MKPHALYLLIVESDLRLSETIRAHLLQTLPQLTPLLARNVAEAHVFIYQYEFSACLIDLSSDGNGLEFIVDLKTVMPEAQILIMTDIPPAAVVPQLQHVGNHHLLQKPLDILEVERTLRVLFPDAGETASFYGSLRQMRLVDLIQVKCLSHDSCQLLITGTGGDHGMITISKGDIIHTKTDSLSGNEAFNEIISWKGGFFHEAAFVDEEVNVTGSWELVLMEAVKRSDECYSLEAI